MINVFQPSLGEEELLAIKKVFESNWLGKGNLTDTFEREFSKHLNVMSPQVLSTTCCTEGLFSSMKVFNIGPGDEVIIPTISFVGAANAVCASGAKLVLCDVDSRTLNVRREDVEKKLSSKTKAILLIHYGGVPCNMDDIIEIALDYNIKVIEDSACSVYSQYKGKACGTIGDMGMWSFDAMKILVCGDGGALYFKESDMAERAKKLLYFGLESSSGYSNFIDKKWWQFNVSMTGHRSIMNDITATMAIEQLKKLPSFIERRKAIHNIYNVELGGVSWLQTPYAIADDCRSSYYFYHIQLNNEYRDLLAHFLRDNDIYTTFRYFPIHRVKYYGINDNYPNADFAADHTLCLPIHQALKDEEVRFICDKIKEFGEINHL